MGDVYHEEAFSWLLYNSSVNRVAGECVQFGFAFDRDYHQHHHHHHHYHIDSSFN